MSEKKMVKGPGFIHPETPSAIGSRNSLYRDNRNEYAESQLLVDEEVDKILNHVSSKLPPEVLSKLDVMGGIKSKLHNYYNQNLQNMLNRYLVTVEDELAAKYRDTVDREEASQMARYTPRLISDLMDKVGEPGSFNTGVIEKSIANAYEHLQGHVERSIKEIEQNTSTLFEQKTDAGAFVRNESSYCLVKCNFKNNGNKPKTVMDVRLAFNVVDYDLKIPIHQYQKPIQDLLKETISDHFHRQIDEKINRINQSLDEDGQSKLTANQEIFEKLKSLETFIGFEESQEGEENPAHQVVAKKFIDGLEGTFFEMPSSAMDPTSIRQSLKHILDEHHILHRGFNQAVNEMTSILDSARMGFQSLDNLKNGRVCIIREYAETNLLELPDETYVVRMSYLGLEQIKAMRVAFDEQSDELLSKVNEAALVIGQVHQEYATEQNHKSYRDVAAEYLKPEEGKEERSWSEVLFQKPSQSELDARTNQRTSETIKKQLTLMKRKVLEVFKNQHPRRRFVIEERINFLEDQFLAFSALVNPHHLQPGLLLEVDITTVKKKRTTMNAMSNVLSEFMHRITNEPDPQWIAEKPLVQPKGEQLTDRSFVSVFDTQPEEKTVPVG